MLREQLYSVTRIKSVAKVDADAQITGPSRTGTLYVETISADISSGSALRPFQYAWHENDNLIGPSCFPNESNILLEEKCYLGILGIKKISLHL